MIIVLLCAISLRSPPSLADVITDGTVGPTAKLVGPDYSIPDSLGTIKGQNLFHSFQHFSITQTETATFTGPDTIANVISRVTGEDVSLIDGMLRSSVGNADFFFINPNGVLFGPNAKVEVPASFHVSTADTLIFDDGSCFNSSLSEQSTLTQAKPEAFGFLGKQKASIELYGTILEFLPENDISLSSNDITLQPSETHISVLACENGHINLTAVGNEVTDILIEEHSTSRHAAGKLVIDNSQLTVNGDGGGNISIDAGDLVISNSYIQSNNFEENDSAGGILVDLTGDLRMINGGILQSSTFSNGNAGTIKVSANNMTIDGRGFLTGFLNESAAINTKGSAGEIRINASGKLTMTNASQISSSTVSHGDAGRIFVSAEEIIIDGEGGLTGIFSQALFDSKGQAGTIEIKNVANCKIENGGILSANSFSPFAHF